MKQKISMIIIFITSISFAQYGIIKSKKEQDIKILLELSGVTELAVQTMVNMMESFKEMLPEVPDKFWTDFMAEIDKAELIALYIPIYDRYYSHNDIKELIIFYKSPVGKKILRVSPYVLQESMQAGEEWGEKLADRVIKKFEYFDY